MGFFSNRRDRIIEQELARLSASGRTEGVARHIHFDAARRYAQDHGGTLWDDMNDSISFDTKIGGRAYNVMFMETSPGGGTDITLTTPLDVSKVFAGDNPLMHQLVQESLSNEAPAVGQPIPLNEARFFFDRFGYQVGASWIGSDGLHSGAGIVDVPALGKCFLLATIAGDRTIVAAQAVPHVEITPDDRAGWFEQLTESVTGWHESVAAKLAAGD
nr:hypothetical protein [Brevundimonas diminuta]